MKKLLIAVAVMACAVAANAAYVNWACYADQDITGYRIYLVTALADYTSEASIGNLLGTGGNQSTAGEYGWSYGNEGTVQGIDGSLDGKTQPFYYVIVNKEGTGYWTQASAAQVYTTSAIHDDADDDVTALMNTAATSWSSGPGPIDTPEPTSGLLLLIGVAGMALRRKQK